MLSVVRRERRVLSAALTDTLATDVCCRHAYRGRRTLRVAPIRPNLARAENFKSEDH